MRPEPKAADSSLCVVCLEEERTHVLIPCGHKCLCTRCAQRYEAHMRFDQSYDDGAALSDDDSDGGDLKCGKSTKPGRAPSTAEGSGKGKARGKTAAASSSTSSSRAPPRGQHACPLCRKAVTAVHLVWE